jgi:hypothetical protein
MEHWPTQIDSDHPVAAEHLDGHTSPSARSAGEIHEGRRRHVLEVATEEIVLVTIG